MAKKKRAKSQASRPKSPKAVRPKSNIKSKKMPKAKLVLSDLWTQKLNWWSVFGIAAVLTIGIASYVMWDFLSHEKILLYKDIASDSINSYWPREVNNQILEEEAKANDWDPATWNWYYGMGKPQLSGAGSPISAVFYSPMIVPSAIVKLTKAKDDNLMVETALNRYIRLISKIFLLFFFSFMYFRVLNLNKLPALLGSLLFTFSGYAMIGIAGWPTELSGVIKCVFLLLALELFMFKKAWYLLPIAVFMLGANPRVAFFGTFGLMYIIARYLEEKDKLDLNFLKKCALGFGMVFIGWLIKGAALIQQFDKFINSPRVSGGASLSGRLSDQDMFAMEQPIHYLTVIMRVFGNDLLGSGSQFKGWYNYLEAPTFYSGILALLLVPQLFQFLSKKAKIAYGSLLGIWLLIILFPYFRYAFYFFAGNYYKAALNAFIPATLIYMSMKALHFIIKEKKFNIPILAGSVLLLLILLFYPYEQARLIDGDMRTLVLALLVLLAGSLVLLKVEGARQVSPALLIGLVVVDLSYNANSSINDRKYRPIDSQARVVQGSQSLPALLTKDELLSKQKGFNDYSMEAIAYLDSLDSGFYRVNKEYSSGWAMHGSINDALVQKFRGTPSYTAQNHRYYIDFLALTGIIDQSSVASAKWAPGLRGRPLLHGFGSVKYHLTKNPKTAFNQYGYQKIAQFGDVSVMKNVNFLPIGFCYEKYIALEDYKKLSIDKKQSMLLKAFVADVENNETHIGLKRITLSDTNYNFTGRMFQRLTDSLRRDTMTNVTFWNNGLEGEISLREDRLLFLSVPYDGGWQATDYGEQIKVELVNGGFVGFPLKAGSHKIRMEYIRPGGIRGESISLGLQYVYLFVCGIFITVPLIRKKKKKKLTEDLEE